jgi:hypothetical protein
MFDKIVDEKIIPYVFKISKHPMMFRELLNANKQYVDGIKLEDAIPGFKVRLGRLYLVFIIIWHMVMLPLVYVGHFFLAKLDCHLSIIFTALATISLFAAYFLFKEWLIDRVALKLIKEAWHNHFIHFDFEKHHQEVAKIYKIALEESIPNSELEYYILSNLSKLS